MKGPPFFTGADIQTAQGTLGPARLLTDLTQRLQLGLVCPWSPPDADNWPGCPDWVRNKRFCWPLSSHCSYNLSHPILSCPRVLDEGIWSKGHRLSWGLETDHLLLQRTRILVLVGPSSSPSFPRGPGKSPIMPEYLQVAEDVCKSIPFIPLSLPDSDLLSLPTPSLSTWPLSLSLKTQVISIYSLCPHLDLKFWVFARDFLRGYTLYSPSIMLFVLRETIAH